MGRRQQASVEDATADQAGRIQARHDEDIHFFRGLREAQLRRARAFGRLRRRAADNTR